MIIGLIGPKGSGKDYTAHVVCTHMNNWKRVAFADPIKQKIAELFGCTLKDVEKLKRSSSLSLIDCNGEVFSTNNTGRDLVRNIGMLMRSYDETQFNRYVKQTIESNPQYNYIVTDVRFPNEVELIRSLNGCLIEITRDGYNYDGHITESGRLRGDVVIHNTNNRQFDEVIMDTFKKLNNYK